MARPLRIEFPGALYNVMAQIKSARDPTQAPTLRPPAGEECPEGKAPNQHYDERTETHDGK